MEKFKYYTISASFFIPFLYSSSKPNNTENLVTDVNSYREGDFIIPASTQGMPSTIHYYTVSATGYE
jgi:hypothetical protein